MTAILRQMKRETRHLLIARFPWLASSILHAWRVIATRPVSRAYLRHTSITRCDASSSYIEGDSDSLRSASHLQSRQNGSSAARQDNLQVTQYLATAGKLAVASSLACVNSLPEAP